MPATRSTGRNRAPAPSASPTDPAADIVNNLRRIVRAIELYSHDVYRTYGLTGPQLWALKTLHKGEALSTGDLAKSLAVQPSTLSILIGRLEARGLVRRGRPRRDRRFVEITLTAEGNRLAAKAPEAAQGRLLHGLRRLKSQELKSLQREIARLVEMMEAEDVEARFFFSDD